MTLDTWARTQSTRCEHGYHRTAQTCPTCPTDEFSLFAAAIRKAARDDGTVHAGDVRPLIAQIPPRHVGVLYRRARAAGLLVDTGEREESTDVAGRNGDKLSRVYRLGRAA